MIITDREARSERANNLQAHGLNGLKMALVDLLPQPGPVKALVTLYFYNALHCADVLADPRKPWEIFSMSGGMRLRGGPDAGQVRVTAIAAHGSATDILDLTVEPIGDYSTYTLSIDTGGIDPLFAAIDFKFRPGCFGLDCSTPRGQYAPAEAAPAIDYLAKDYDSFKHVMIAAMAQRVPGWKPTSEADLDQVLIDQIAATADELSDYQDRVVNEAYLATARKRVSLARHCRLVDYHIHQGSQADTWLALMVNGTGWVDIPSDLVVWAGTERLDSDAVVYAARSLARVNDGFSLERRFASDLAAATLSSTLRAACAASGIRIETTATIVATGSNRWKLTDAYTGCEFDIAKRPRSLWVKPHNRLSPWLNALRLYTWSGSVRSLARGATQADLLVDEPIPALQKQAALTVQNTLCNGAEHAFLFQEWLNPDTGRTAGRELAKRQIVTIESARAMQDPFTGAWFVRVGWIEALAHEFQFMAEYPSQTRTDISLVHGNLMRAFHGRPVTAVFREKTAATALDDPYCIERTTAGAIVALQENPLWVSTAADGDTPPMSTVTVTVTVPSGSQPWREMASLIHSTGDDPHFVVEADEDEHCVVRFGNGANGRELPDNAVVTCTYQTGNNNLGNIGADTLTRYDRLARPRIAACWNPCAIVNGTAPQSSAHIIRHAPVAYRLRQLRAITRADYEARVMEIGEVSHVKASYRWTGSWRTVRIAVDPRGSFELNTALCEKIGRYIDAVRLIGEDIEIRPPHYVPLQIRVTVCVHPDFWPEEIAPLLSAEFSDSILPSGVNGFFHPDQWTFGQCLHASEIMGRAQSITGINHVKSVDMKRMDARGDGTQPVIVVAPEEIVMVRTDPDHRERGFVEFDLQGGRR